MNCRRKQYSVSFKHYFAIVIVLFLLLMRKDFVYAGMPTTTDGVLRYQLLSAEEHTVQVGTGDDSQPSAVATGLYDKSVTSINIPATIVISGETYRVTKISCYAFYRCTNLKSITIGENVEEMGVGAFKYCNNVTNLTWKAKSVKDFASSNQSGSGNVFAYLGSQTTGVSVNFADTVERIPSYAFYTNSSSHQYCDKIKTITFGKNIKEIGSFAFAKSELLQSVVLPQALTSIPAYCFMDCTALNMIMIGDNVSEIKAKAFYGCEAVSVLSVGKGVKTIDNDAFSGWSKLSVLQWNAVEANDFPLNNGIFTAAGQDTAGITVTVGASVCHIPANLFYPKVGALSSDNAKVKSVTFSTGTAESLSIGANAFRNCNELTKLTLGTNVTTIGDNAFNGCSNISSLTWNAIKIADFKQGNGVFAELGSNTSGVTVTFGANVNYIPAYAFAPDASGFGKKCNIINVRITSGTAPVEIGDNAFRACPKLEDCQWRERVKSVGDYAFYGCTGLTEIALDGQAQTIGEYAYAQCSQVATIVIGSAVTEIGTGVFNGIGSNYSKPVNIYQSSEVNLVSGVHYNGLYCNIYSALTVDCAHGDYTLTGSDAVVRNKINYYKKNDSLVLSVTPVCLLTDAWEVEKVLMNETEVDKMPGVLRQFSITLPARASKIIVDFEQIDVSRFKVAIGQKGYQSIEEAITVAGEGTTIEVLKEFSLDATVEINKSLTINGNCHSIQRTVDGKMFVVKNGADVTMQDVVLDGAQLAGSIVSVENGIFNLDGNSIIENNKLSTEGSTYGYGTVWITGGSTFNLYDGTISNNEAVNGGAVYLHDGTMNMQGGKICNNYAAKSGGGIYVKTQTALSLSAGKILENECLLRGGGIYLQAESMDVCGNPCVKDNINSTGIQNIYFTSENTRICLVDILDKAVLGVTTYKNPSNTTINGVTTTTDIPVTIGATGQYKGEIFADNNSYAAEIKEDGELYLIQGLYQIGFDAMGGEMIVNAKKATATTLSVKGGTNLSRAVDSAITSIRKTEGNTVFNGWYDEDGNKLTSDIVAAKDAAYYARWAIGTCSAPVFDVEEGTYSGSVNVSISAGDGEKIYYTTDGSEPLEDGSNCILYQTPIEVTEDTTIRAISVRDEYVTSEEVQRTYRIWHVDSVQITTQASEIKQGEQMTLEAEVRAQNQSTPKDVIWSLEGDYVSGTGINERGVLTVSESETAGEIVVVATSAVDPASKDSITLTVIGTYPVYYHYGFESQGNDTCIERYAEDTKVLVIDAPARDGYTFLGWATDEGEDADVVYKPADEFSMQAQEMHLYAKWIINSVTGVQIYMDGSFSNQATDLVIDCGDSLSLFTKVTGTGTFDTAVTWSLEGDHSTGTTVKNGVVTVASDEAAESFVLKAVSTKDTTIYATANIKVRYTITYHLGYQVDENETITEKKIGTRDFVLQTPSQREGYTFNGWKMEKTGTDVSLYQPGITWNSGKGNVELYADWTQNQILNIVIMKRGNTVTPITKVTINSEDEIAFDAVVTGQGTYSDEVSWRLQEGASDPVTRIVDGALIIGQDETAEELTVEAVSVEDPTMSARVDVTIVYPYCTITYHSNSTSIPNGAMLVKGNMEPQKIKKNQAVPVEECTYEMEGYTFIGWNTKSDGSGKTYQTEQLLIAEDSMTLYAMWQCNRVTDIKITKKESTVTVTKVSVKYEDKTIAFDAKVSGEGEYSDAVLWSIKEGANDSATTVADGILTIGENESSDKLVVEAAAVADPAVSAQVEVTITYPDCIVTYNSNADSVPSGSSLVRGYMNAERTKKNHVYTAKANGYIIQGYTFNGWNTKSDGTGDVYKAQASITVSNDIILYAMWQKNDAASSDNPSNTGNNGVNTPVIKDTTLPVGSTFTDIKSGASYKVIESGSTLKVAYKQPIFVKSTMVIPDTVTYRGKTYTVAAIADKAFSNKAVVTTVTIGNQVEKIGTKAFSGCKKLKKVTIGLKVTEIGKQAFMGCKSLKTITIKSTVLKKVGSKAFKSIDDKAIIKVPKKKKKAYQKLLKAKGLKATAKIK